MRTFTNRRCFIIAAFAAAGLLAGAAGASAQLERVIDPDWTMPRTPDGQPDLQGMWGNKTLTPIERPANVEGRAFLTDEEIAAINQQRVVDEQSRDAAPARRYEAGSNVGGYGSYWLDAGDTVLSTGQTSLIVDPPDGRARIRQWALDAKQYNLDHNGDDYVHMSVWDRCLSRGVPGSMLPAGYNNAYRIVQTPDHFVVNGRRKVTYSRQPSVRSSPASDLFLVIDGEEDAGCGRCGKPRSSRFSKLPVGAVFASMGSVGVHGPGVGRQRCVRVA